MRNFTTDKIKGLSRIDLARRVNQYYSRSIQERVIVNTDTGIRIYFNSVGRIKSAKRYSSKEKAIVIINLLVLLAEAKRVSTKTIRENSAIYKNIPGALMVFNFLIKLG